MDKENIFKTELIGTHKSNKARVLQVTTPHGIFHTPSFMPVGTRAAVNCMTTTNLEESGAQIILGGNTYHMLCAPGLETIKLAGGMHKFMAWNKPMLIDSGGFQIFSLSKNSKICKIDETGGKFKHPNTGQVIHLTPESSIIAQKIMGADIVMAFDQCTADTEDKDFVNKAMTRTHRWLKQSLNLHLQNPNSEYGLKQAFFGIIQGGFYEELRKESAEFIVSLNTDGIAIGGESIGFDMDKTMQILQWIEPILPSNKVRYTMGVGLTPQNLLDVVQMGVDIFDCVAPTRNARHGSLYSGEIKKVNNWLKFESEFPNGKMNLNNASHANDMRPIMETCQCYTCKNFSRAYMRYLLKSESLLYYNLASIHNIQVMQDVCKKMRQFIIEN